jgi:arsenate reductase
MSKLSIYHNPRCSKSRQALQLLQEKGVEPEIILYLNEVPTRDEFKTVLMKLNLKPQDILRKGEPIFKEKFKNSDFTEDEWITVMLENPKLIERPIVIKDHKAVVARPPELALELI